MATKKEKQLAIQLLKERIERLTGKKVMFKESNLDDNIHDMANYYDDYGLGDFLDRFDVENVQRLRSLVEINSKEYQILNTLVVHFDSAKKFHEAAQELLEYAG